MRRYVSFAGALFAANLKASTAERGAFAMQVLFMALNNATFFVFWWALMIRIPELRGWRLTDMQVLFGIAAAGFGLTVTFAGGVRHLGRFIYEGELDALLTQPKPVLPYAVGLRLSASGFGDVLSGLLFLALSGQVGVRTVPAVAVAILTSALVILASGVMFFSLAFWLGNVESLSRQLWDLTITFALYPEPLFGGVLRLLLFTVVPAAFVSYLPAHVVLHPSPGGIVVLLSGAAAYLTAAAAMFDRGLRRYSSGSRFGTFG